jgi:transcriptional regulator with XRE-family HTH domain
MNIFTKRLAETMEMVGITQTALAKRMNVSQQSISYWVNGTYEPSLSEIAELCKILEVKANYLIGITEY